MIEVELRWELTKEKFEELNDFFTTNGKLTEIQDREMILLRDTPGYADDPTIREKDIRIRRTNWETEIMVKEMKSINNVARSENSFKFGNIEIEEVKKFVAYFWSHKGQWMHRKKKVYFWNDVHWSLVEAVPDIFYFEAEKEIEDEGDIEKTHEELKNVVSSLSLPIMENQYYKDFIKMLGEKVNKYITW